jgi:hypothetical protein
LEKDGEEEGGGRYYMLLKEEEGVGAFEGCTFTKISNMGLYVPVIVSLSCRTLFSDHICKILLKC